MGAVFWKMGGADIWGVSLLHPGEIAPFGNHYHTLETCGNGYASGAESLILGGGVGLFRENGVVFLQKVRWISFRR